MAAGLPPRRFSSLRSRHVFAIAAFDSRWFSERRQFTRHAAAASSMPPFRLTATAAFHFRHHAFEATAGFRMFSSMMAARLLFRRTDFIISDALSSLRSFSQLLFAIRHFVILFSMSLCFHAADIAAAADKLYFILQHVEFSPRFIAEDARGFADRFSSALRRHADVITPIAGFACASHQFRHRPRDYYFSFAERYFRELYYDFISAAALISFSARR